MTLIRPVDPAVSIYPLPMSARRARFEARNARRHRLRLPKGHPYRSLPTWLPYKLAILISRSQNQNK